MNAFRERHRRAGIVLICNQQLQLLGHSRDQPVQFVHLLRHLVVFPLPVTVCYQTLDRTSG